MPLAHSNGLLNQGNYDSSETEMFKTWISLQAVISRAESVVQARNGAVCTWPHKLLLPQTGQTKVFRDDSQEAIKSCWNPKNHVKRAIESSLILLLKVKLWSSDEAWGATNYLLFNLTRKRGHHRPPIESGCLGFPASSVPSSGRARTSTGSSSRLKVRSLTFTASNYSNNRKSQKHRCICERRQPKGGNFLVDVWFVPFMLKWKMLGIRY